MDETTSGIEFLDGRISEHIAVTKLTHSQVMHKFVEEGQKVQAVLSAVQQQDQKVQHLFECMRVIATAMKVELPPPPEVADIHKPLLKLRKGPRVVKQRRAAAAMFGKKSPGANLVAAFGDKTLKPKPGAESAK